MTDHAVAIGVPLHNEAARIEDCVHALDVAAGRVSATVTLVAFANGCTDDSVARLRALVPSHVRLDVRDASLLLEARHAGWARRLALDAAAAHLDRDDDALLSTDADTRVAPYWIAANLRHLDAGCDAVAGLALTTTDDRASLGAAAKKRLDMLGRYGVCLNYLRARADPDPYDAWPRHGYEGGASIALSARLYRAIGGAPTPPVAEDRALFAAVRAHGGCVRHAIDARVFTSCRLDGRAPGGMADTLRAWAVQDDDAPVHETYGVVASLRGYRALNERLTFRTLPAQLALAQSLVHADQTRRHRSSRYASCRSA